jgi:hypothetical protein
MMSPPKLKSGPSGAQHHRAGGAAGDRGRGIGELVGRLLVDPVLRRVVQRQRGDAVLDGVCEMRHDGSSVSLRDA